jgi:hypothetical protein
MGKEEVRFDEVENKWFCQWCGTARFDDRFQAYGHLARCEARKAGQGVAVERGDPVNINEGVSGSGSREGEGSKKISPLVPIGQIDPSKIVLIDHSKIVLSLWREVDSLKRIVLNENYHLRQVVSESRSSSVNIWVAVLAGIGGFLLGLLVGQAISCGPSSSFSLGKIAGSAIQGSINYALRRGISRVL